MIIKYAKITVANANVTERLMAASASVVTELSDSLSLIHI